MVQKVSFDQLTQLGGVADPTLAQDTATKNYVDSKPTGVTIAQVDAEIATKVGSVVDARTQVSGGTSVTGVIVNQVVGQPVQMTITTANIDVAAQVNLLNGGSRYTVANTTTDGTTLLVTHYTAGIFQITATFDNTVTLAQAQALFSSSRSDSVYAGTPTSGNFLFQAPPRNEIVNLINQNVPTSVSQLALDVISWTNDAQVAYVSDKSIPQQNVTVKPLSLTGVWEFTDVATIPGFTDGAAIIGTDNTGRTVSGVYTAGTGGGFATMAQVNAERTSGFVVNTSYPMVWRQGVLASASFYVDNGEAGIGNHKVNTLSPGNNITITPDPLNPGRSVIASTASGGGTGSPWTYIPTVTTQQEYTIPAGYTTNTAIVVLNGSTLAPTTDYTISGTTLTIVPSIITGDLLGIAATGEAGGAAALPFSGNGITGSVTPTSIVMGANTSGSFNAATSALTISATSGNNGPDFSVRNDNVVLNSVNVPNRVDTTTTYPVVISFAATADVSVNTTFTFNGVVAHYAYVVGDTIVISAQDGSFSIEGTVTALTGSGTTSTAGSITGFLNGKYNTQITATNTDAYISLLRPVGVSSIDNLTGPLTFGSTDGSVAITPLGSNIDFKTNPTGTAGTATGYNIGQFVQADVSTYAAPTEAGGQLWMVQVGSGTGYSSDSTIIAPSTTTNGWRFFGQQAKNVVAELGAQTQLFRMTLNGQTYQYNRTPAQVLGDPHFLKTGRDINTTADQFPGFTNNFIVYADLRPVNTLVAEARLCLNSGNVVSGITTVSSAGQNVPAGTPVCTVTHDGGTVATSTCTLPLEAQLAGVWTYIGAEWPVSATPTGTTTQLTLTTPLATLPDNTQLRIQQGSGVTRVFFWQTAFRGDLILGDTTLSNATYELRVQPNTWTEDSASINPSGFTLPATYTAGNNNQFNFAWGITNGTYIASLPNTNYWHYNSTGSTVTNSPYTPNTAANWNNRVTVNVSATVVQKWTDYVTRWASAPVFLANATQNFGTVATPVNIAGKDYLHKWCNTTAYWVPNIQSNNLTGGLC